MENGETGITSTFSVYQDENILSLTIFGMENIPIIMFIISP